MHFNRYTGAYYCDRCRALLEEWNPDLPDLFVPEPLMEDPMHHSSRPDPEFKRILAAGGFTQSAEPTAIVVPNGAGGEVLGPTGRMADPPLVSSDEGEIAFAVGTYHGKLVVNFGAPVAWLGMTREQALAFADKVRRNALGLPKQRRR